ncbi:hypothetical protein [Pseudonocardia sp. TRM90224]|uniref:hypothetical protein n=1 Tax=Pseudonocardia sp. TRM90224 TaxID=2812678 RepID=UPI001E32996E|nr:hypothetical protein [Pseudonocardia sp. TRM90224]
MSTLISNDAPIGRTTTADLQESPHWSEALPPGTGKSVYAAVWLIPLTAAAGLTAGDLLRWWLS